MEKYKYFTSFTDATRQLVMLHISGTVLLKRNGRNNRQIVAR